MNVGVGAYGNQDVVARIALREVLDGLARPDMLIDCQLDQLLLLRDSIELRLGGLECRIILSQLPLVAVYASPIKRAADTADSIAAEAGLEAAITEMGEFLQELGTLRSGVPDYKPPIFGGAFGPMKLLLCFLTTMPLPSAQPPEPSPCPRSPCSPSRSAEALRTGA